MAATTTNSCPHGAPFPGRTRRCLSCFPAHRGLPADPCRPLPSNCESALRTGPTIDRNRGRSPGWTDEHAPAPHPRRPGTPSVELRRPAHRPPPRGLGSFGSTSLGRPSGSPAPPPRSRNRRRSPRSATQDDCPCTRWPNAERATPWYRNPEPTGLRRTSHGTRPASIPSRITKPRVSSGSIALQRVAKGKPSSRGLR